MRVTAFAVQLFACLLLLGALGCQNRLPNVVFILADDMGYGDASCYNADSKIQTPNIDELARQGIRFMDAHTPSSVCTPSRYGLLTGRYCWRTRVKKGVILGYDEAPLIESGRETLGSLMQKAGYSTACIGKWHVGLHWQTKNGYAIQDDKNQWLNYSGVFRENEENIDFSKPVCGGPNDLGFDYSFITLGCSTSDNPYCFIENNYTVGVPSVMLADKWQGLPGVVTAKMVPDWSMEEVDPIFTQKAIEFIERSIVEKPKSPFFLYLALSSPHIPFLPPDFAKGTSAEGPRGDLVKVVDWSVGKLMETLDKHEISDETLVIFTSDNGPRRGANQLHSAGEFRGYKATIWEGGHRVPFIARWPGMINPGLESDQLISLTDMLATFAELSQQPMASESGEDSYSVYPALLGEELKDTVETIRVFHSVSGVFALRKGNWKFIEGTKGGGNGRINLTEDSLRLVGQLYNLSTDPGEQTNLFSRYPEKVMELKAELQAIRKSIPKR